MKMKVSLFALLVGIGLIAVNAVEVPSENVGKISDIVAKCKNACPENNIYCAGYNDKDAEEDDKCNRDVGTDNCNLAFTTFRKISKDKFGIQLVGKVANPNEGIGLRLITQSDSVTTSGEHGFNCHIAEDNKFHIDRLQADPVKDKAGLQYRNEEDDDIFIHSGVMAKDPDHPEWIVCQLEFEIQENAYKLQFLKLTAGKPDANDPENIKFTEDPNAQTWSHNQLFFMKELKGKDEGGDDGAGGGKAPEKSSGTRFEPGLVCWLLVSIFMVKQSMA